MKKLYYGLSLLTVGCLLSACEDVLGGGSGVDFDENTVVFTIGGNTTSATRAEARTVVAPSSVIDLPVEEGDETAYCLVETVMNLDDICYDATLGTRATPAYTENFDALYGNDLYVTAFEPKGGSNKLTSVWGSYLENGGTVNFKKVDGTTNTYAYDYSKGQAANLPWPESEKLWFFIQAPYTTTSALSPAFYDNGSIQFNYESPKAATAQIDILFSSKKLTKKTKDTDNNILMYHALTGVKFKVDPDLGLKKDAAKVVITKVTLKDISSKGHCTITPNYTDANTNAKSNKSNKSGDAATKSAACSVWSSLGTPASFTINPSAEYADPSKSDYAYAESFYADKTAEGNLNDDDFTQTFFLIPQKVEGKVVEVTYTVGDEKKEYTRTVKFPKDAEWKAGELHTYTLTVNVVGISVTDKVNDQGTVKSDVAITNTGNVVAYLRAAVAAAWYYNGNNGILTIVGPYEGEGKFETSSTTPTSEGFSSVWIKGDDGYYYYPYPVQAGEKTNAALFDKFTAPAEDKDYYFSLSHLEMKILVQAVQAGINGDTPEMYKDRVTKAWGTVKVAGSDDLVVSRLFATPETPSK